jgi:chromosome segregation ATPase
MKNAKILSLISFLSVFLVCSCANKPMRAVIIDPIKPRVEQVEIQAKKTTSAAELTKDLAKKVQEKYKDDTDVAKTVDAANKTIAQSRETEGQLAMLKVRAENADNELKTSEQQNETLKKDIKKESQKVVFLTDENKTLKQKIWNYRAYLAALVVVVLAAVAFVVKPWKWFM